MSDGSYDVFISVKATAEGQPTRDAQLARELHSYLRDRGLRVFLSEVSLRERGESQFSQAIYDAIDSAHTLVLVCTRAEHLEGEWVREEWQTFKQDMLSRKKKGGRIFLLLEGVSYNQLPTGLRGHQAVTVAEGALESLYHFIQPTASASAARGGPPTGRRSSFRVAPLLAVTLGLGGTIGGLAYLKSSRGPSTLVQGNEAPGVDAKVVRKVPQGTQPLQHNATALASDSSIAGRITLHPAIRRMIDPGDIIFLMVSDERDSLIAVFMSAVGADTPFPLSFTVAKDMRDRGLPAKMKVAAKLSKVGYSESVQPGDLVSETVSVARGMHDIVVRLDLVQQRPGSDPVTAMATLPASQRVIITKEGASEVTTNLASCTAGSADSCRVAAEAYGLGRGVTKDESRAATLLRKACDLKDFGSCTNLAVAYSKGLGVPRDQAQAFRLLDENCRRKHVRACSLLAVSYVFGEGVRADSRRAADLLLGSCNSGDADGCHYLGMLYYEGKGVEADRQLAATGFQRACDKGRIEDCYHVGLLLADPKAAVQDYRRALELHRKSCEGGHVKACTALGFLQFHGRGMERDAAAAAASWKVACDGADGEGCFTLAVTYEEGKPGVRQDWLAAARFYERACALKEWRGCTNLAAMLQDGRGTKPDPTRAAVFLKQACDGNDANACGLLGDAVQKGRGVPRDPTRSKRLLAIACKGGQRWACRSTEATAVGAASKPGARP
jgi:TPR repeat protein